MSPTAKTGRSSTAQTTTGNLFHGPDDDGLVPHGPDDDAPATAQAKQRAKEERRAEDGKRGRRGGRKHWAAADGRKTMADAECGGMRRKCGNFPSDQGTIPEPTSRTKHGKIWRARAK